MNKYLAWQLWFHYLPLALAILLTIPFLVFYNKIYQVAILFAVIAITDLALHVILKKYTKWSD